jgi:hypothetical protein
LVTFESTRIASNVAQDLGEVEGLDSPEGQWMQPLQGFEKARKPCVQLETRAETGDHRRVGLQTESKLIVEKETGGFGGKIEDTIHLDTYLKKNRLTGSAAERSRCGSLEESERAR